MNKCKYELNFEDEHYTFPSEEALNEFLLKNYSSVKQKMKGQNISASKPLFGGLLNKASDINIAMEDILAETMQLGGITTDYMEDLDQKVEKPGQILKDKGFLAVTKHIDQKKAMVNGEVKQIIKEYRREEHKSRIFYKYVADMLHFDSTLTYNQLSDEQLELYNEKKNEILNDSDKLALVEKHISDLIEKYERANIYGRVIHQAIEVTMQELSRVGYDTFINTFTPERLEELNTIEINGLTDRESVVTNQLLYNMIMGTGRKKGLLQTLNLANQAYVYSEFPMTYQNPDNPEVKLAGVADLIIVDKDGKLSIYDFKTSNNLVDHWSSEKQFRLRQQLGYYAAILKSKGLVVNDMYYVPIITDTTNDFKTISDITVNNNESISADLTLTKNTIYSRIRAQISEDIVEDNAEKNIQDVESLIPIGEFLKTTLNVDYKDKVKKIDLEKLFESIWSKSLKRDILGKSVHSFYNPITGLTEVLPENKDKQKEHFIKIHNDYNDKVLGGTLVSVVESAITRYKKLREQENDFLKKDEIPFKLFPRDTIENEYFIKTFGKYRGEEWKLLENATANQLGFIMFLNNITKTIDIVSVSDDHLEESHDLGLGTTLLGKKYSDYKLANDKKLIKSTKGNIELMKVMAFINFNTDFFSQKGYSIGGIKQVTKNSTGQLIPYDILKYNFAKLCDNFDYKESYNLNKQNIKLTSPVQILLSTIINMDELADYKRLGFKDSTHIGSFKNDLAEQTKNEISIDWSYEQSKNEILKVLNNELIERVKRFKYDTLKNATESDHFTKLIADQINYYTNHYTPQLESELQATTLWSNSINNLPSPLINSARKILNVATENIKIKFLQFKEDLTPSTNNLFEKSGYSNIRRYTLGDHTNQFKSLFEYKNNEIDPRFILRDPFTDKKLSEAQKSYLKHILTIMNSMRNSKETIEELSQKGDVAYRQVPLVRMSALSALKKGDYKSQIKQMVDKVADPMVNLFGSDEIAEEPLKQEFLNVRNFIQSQNDAVRSEMLQSGTHSFETDLEVIMDLFMLTYLRSEEFDKALPLIQSAKVQAIMDNAGVLKDITPIIDFIDRHLKINVKGEKLMDQNEKKQDKWLSSLRQLTSTFNLALNPISITRESLQGFYGAMSRASVHMYGENTHSMTDLLWQFKTVTGESTKDLWSDMNIIEALNISHGLSNVNLGSIIDRASNSKTGIPHFFSNYIQGLNRAPEYMTRMGIFLAELKKDNAWKAYSYKDNKLTYNWKLDGRFEIYAKYKDSNPPEALKEKFLDQQGLYTTLLREFNAENTDKVYTDLPHAYTNKQVESIKAYSDSILGYYDPATKIQQQSTLLGANFMHFKTWMVAVKDKWLLTGHRSEIIGSYKSMKNELGEQLYMTPDGSYTTEQNGNTKALVWEGKWNEGILMSIVRLISASKSGGFQSIKDLWLAEDKIRQNVKLMSRDILMLMLMALLLAVTIKDKESYTSQIANAAITAPSDLNPFKTASSILSPAGGWIFPSLSYFAKLGQGLERVVFDDANGAKFVYSAFGLTRPLQYFIED